MGSLSGLVVSQGAYADGFYYSWYDGTQSGLSWIAEPGSEAVNYYRETGGKVIGGTMRRDGGSYIYFLYMNADLSAMEKGLYRVAIEPGATAELINAECNDTVISPDDSTYLFFIAGEEGNQIVRFQEDGTGATIWRTAEQPILQLSVAEPYLYMMTEDKYASWAYNAE